MTKQGESERKWKRSSPEDGKARLEAGSSAEPNTGCWLWSGRCDPKGYGLMAYRGERRAHRAAWMLHNGPIPKDMYVCHKCDVRSCVNPQHLFLGSAADNNRDRNAKGRTAKGGAVGGARLTADDVLKIRAARAGGKGSVVLAREFGVNSSHIRRICNGDNWEGAMLAEVEKLRSQVATLERELANHKTSVDGLEDLWEQQKARAEAAERRVAELEAECNARAGAAEVAREHMRRGSIDEARAALSRAGARQPTHPAPAGLMEAVGPVLKALEGYSIALAQEGGDSRAIPVWLSKAEARAIRTAAKGGEAPPTTVLDGCDFVAHRKRQVEEEKAAKWDAAVERAKDVDAMTNASANFPSELRDDDRENIGRYVTRCSRYILGLDTPPSGPGGGETWCGCERDCLDDSGHCEKHGSNRAATDAQPEPAAPDVVWTGEGAEVRADGRVLYPATMTPGKVAYVLARALAEAKRELSTAEVALNQWQDTADGYARKAAESMRERAARVVVGYYARCTQPRCITCNAMQAAESEIKALSLEDK